MRALSGVITMKYVDLEQGSKEWLLWRLRGITATDAAVLLGRSPYKTVWRLWAEKSGYATEVDLSLNPLVQAGKRNETRARAAYEAKVGQLILPACVESSRIPLLRASLDGLRGANEPVEIKCPSDKVWHDVATNGTQSREFKLYACQVQHQLLVTEASHGWLVFWHAEHGLLEFKITSDDALLRVLVKRAAEFWNQLQSGVEPEKDPERDLYFPTDDGHADAWINQALEYREAQSEIEALKEKLKRLESKQNQSLDALKGLMGEYFHAEYAGVMVTRYKSKGRIDNASIYADLKRRGVDVDVDQYRGQPSTRYRVTVSDTVAPRNIVDRSVLAPLDAIT